MSQWRSVLRSQSVSLLWEQKIVTQCLKTLAINAFVAYRMNECKEYLQSKETFRTLTYFRGKMNKVNSLSDFTIAAAEELLDVANHLDLMPHAATIATAHHVVGVGEKNRLIALARTRQRNKLAFFNSCDGIALRYVGARCWRR